MFPCLVFHGDLTGPAIIVALADAFQIMASQDRPSGLNGCNDWISQRRGIFGGTFNPPHCGHLQIAQVACQQVGLTQLLWIPTYCPPYRAPETLATFQHRLAMVEQAIAPFPAFQASAVERDLTQRQGGYSFAIDTLTHLQQQYPSSHWYWILGLDSFRTLPRWRHYEQLIPQCTWLIAPRTDYSSSFRAQGQGGKQQAEAIAQQLHQQGISLQWQWLSMSPVDVSSSLIRRYRGDRQGITGLVPVMVENYIQRYNLYQSDS